MIKSNIDYAIFDLADIVRLFEGANNLDIAVNLSEKNSQSLVNVIFDKINQSYAYPKVDGDIIFKKRIIKRYLKLSLYLSLSFFYKSQLPWGSLTGIRPVKLAYQLIDEGKDFYNEFIDFFKVLPQKTQLVKDIILNQTALLSKIKNTRQLFINIPFCPSKCYYCSFTSAVAHSGDFLLEKYTDALISEIVAAKSIDNNYLTCYIGGGTPVILPDNLLEKVLQAACGNYLEFTVEAGRADCITESKLKLFKKYGVSRICINPQTFNDETLKKIGRTHTAQDVYDAFTLSKKFEFDVNVDLIAGLKDETAKMFKKSLDMAVKLKPQNITVHTLSIKAGSTLKNTTDKLGQKDIDKMLKYSYDTLKKSGYLPYYMYRQKYTAANFENVGFCLSDKQCIYNIAIMEEVSDIVACGANAFSKRVFHKDNRIERLKNPKDIKTYLEKIHLIINRKRSFYN